MLSVSLLMLCFMFREQDFFVLIKNIRARIDRISSVPLGVGLLIPHGINHGGGRRIVDFGSSLDDCQLGLLVSVR